VIYLSLFVISFLAATILPFSSELTLAGLIATSDYDNLLLFIVASFGNVLGSVVNWALGSYSRNLTTKKWFPFKETQIERSSKWFRKFGKWSLLFAWVPVVGDPLTLVAGISRVKFIDFIILVAIGKVSRYLIVFYLIG
jgi:membrane protein YqaA with SNARE-associated domain